MSREDYSCPGHYIRGALLNLNGLRCGASNPRSITGVVKIMVAMDIINTPGILSNDSMETV